jgi:hypothetical protein
LVLTKDRDPVHRIQMLCRLDQEEQLCHFFNLLPAETDKLFKTRLIMAPIKVGNLSVEITVNNTDGFIHEVVDLPSPHGFWVNFTVKDDNGKIENFPMIDFNHRIKVHGSYQEALYDAAQKIIGKKNTS